MKLTKKQEAEVMKVYNAYWDGYIKGDVKGMAALLDKNYTQVGSAEGEVFSNKKDAVKFLHNTIDQVAGKAKMKNRVITMEALQETVLINERCDLFALAEGKWIFYSKFRASTFLKEEKGKWKIIHQHSSVPDMRTSDGENLATEKISAENLQLRDAVKRRTVELEQKNRELEIESALDRVRAVAMGMRKREELARIGETLFTELKALDFTTLRNTEIIINNDSKETIVIYYYSDYGVAGTLEMDYKKNPKVRS